MVITAENVILVLAILADILMKATTVAKTGVVQNIDDEIMKLNALRLRPSEDIIKEADLVSKEG